jgi:hypothetical protein
MTKEIWSNLEVDNLFFREPGLTEPHTDRFYPDPVTESRQFIAQITTFQVENPIGYFIE